MGVVVTMLITIAIIVLLRQTNYCLYLSTGPVVHKLYFVYFFLNNNKQYLKLKKKDTDLAWLVKWPMPGHLLFLFGLLRIAGLLTGLIFFFFFFFSHASCYDKIYTHIGFPLNIKFFFIGFISFMSLSLSFLVYIVCGG